VSPPKLPSNEFCRRLTRTECRESSQFGRAVRRSVSPLTLLPEQVGSGPPRSGTARGLRRSSHELGELLRWFHPPERLWREGVDCVESSPVLTRSGWHRAVVAALCAVVVLAAACSRSSTSTVTPYAAPLCPSSTAATDSEGVKLSISLADRGSAVERFVVSAQIVDDRIVQGSSAGYSAGIYVSVRPADAPGPTYVSRAGSENGIGRPSGRPRSPDTQLVDWDGAVCTGGQPGQVFSRSAPAGGYEAKALFVVGNRVWSSVPVGFEWQRPT
jgi:hypothetical protein